MVVAKRQGNQPRNHSYKWIKHSCHKSSVETQKEYDFYVWQKQTLPGKIAAQRRTALIYRFSFFRCRLCFVWRTLRYCSTRRRFSGSSSVVDKKDSAGKKERVLSFSSFSLVPPRRFLCVSLAALKKRRNEVDFQSFLMFSGGSRGSRYYYMS